MMPDRFGALEADYFALQYTLLFPHLTHNRIVLLDFSKTTFIDSCGIGALIKVLKHSKEKAIELAVIHPGEQVCAVLKMTGLEHLFIHDNKSQLETVSEPEFNKSALPETHPSVTSIKKRVIDILGSSIGLLILSVLFVPIALAIKLESRGPLFFQQTRMGWLGSQFKIFKFRTMIDNAEAYKHTIKNEAKGAIFKNANDPRITRVGNFLRQTSLDELPQFWNVLEGSMSLVGTRPPTLDETTKYSVLQWQRLDVRPGITGEWQVSGRSMIKSFDEIIQMDMDYQNKWSPWYDLKLLIKTIQVVFSKANGAL
ncbi:MAG: sugar transferase [Pseudomonadota bacterium]